MKKYLGLRVFMAMLIGLFIISAFAPSTAVSKLYKVGNVDYKKTTIATGDTATYITLVTSESGTFYDIDSIRQNTYFTLSNATKAVPGNRLFLSITCAGTAKAIYFKGNLVNRDTLTLVAAKTSTIEFVYDGKRYLSLATGHRAD